MDTRRLFLATLAAFATVLVLDVLLNFVLLAELYRQTAAVWRPTQDLERLMPLIWVGMGVSTLFFTLIYAQGYERDKAGVAQGVRFGLYMGLFYLILYCAVSYVVLPVPASLVSYWFFGGLVEYAAAGAVVGWMYRGPQPARRAAAVAPRPARRRAKAKR